MLKLRATYIPREYKPANKDEGFVESTHGVWEDGIPEVVTIIQVTQFDNEVSIALFINSSYKFGEDSITRFSDIDTLEVIQ